MSRPNVGTISFDMSSNNTQNWLNFGPTNVGWLLGEMSGPFDRSFKLSVLLKGTLSRRFPCFGLIFAKIFT